MLKQIEPLLPKQVFNTAEGDERDKHISDLSYERLQNLHQVIDCKRDSHFNSRIDTILKNQAAEIGDAIRATKLRYKAQ